MSAKLISASEPGGNNASVQGTMVGGSKPLHRFITGHPKATGIVMLVMGTSFFMLSVAITTEDTDHMLWTGLPSGFYVGTLFIACGIMYVVTEHNTTKKTVTISLALSIVSIVISCWSFIQNVPTIYHNYQQYKHHGEYIHNMTEMETLYWEPYEGIVFTVETIFTFYTFVGVTIITVMTCLAVAALRSTLTQVIIVVTSTPAEKPVE